jgi:UDPglucose--hexose-1-phosphate uridylyltransferase
MEPQMRRAGQLHLQLTSPRRAADKLKYLAGSEAAMGAFINDTTPESVAARLREMAGESSGVVTGAVSSPATIAPEGARA